MTRHTIAQQRAAHALARAGRRGSEAGYDVATKDFPATILMNGLGQTLAMALATARRQGGDVRLAVAADVTDWLCNRWPDSPVAGVARGDGEAARIRSLIEHIMSSLDPRGYTLVQAEALAYLEWLKTFAVGLSVGDGGAQHTDATGDDPAPGGA